MAENRRRGVIHTGGMFSMCVKKCGRTVDVFLHKPGDGVSAFCLPCLNALSFEEKTGFKNAQCDRCPDGPKIRNSGWWLCNICYGIWEKLL